MLKNFPLKIKDIANNTGLSQSRIRQLSSELEKIDLAIKFIHWWYKPEAIAWINQRPENRGKKKILC